MSTPRKKQIRVSHLTISQAARFAEVKVQSAHERLRSVAILEHGVWMVPADEVRRYYRERLKARRLGLSPTTPLGTMHP